MTDQSPRWAFALLQPGQAQKELFHNEAIVAIDLITQAVVLGVGIDVPPTDPAIGGCWIVGDAPTGAWAAHAGALAGWTEGGWRFVTPREGMQVWVASQSVPARFSATGWRVGPVECASVTVEGQQVVGGRQPAISPPSGGAVTDVEARAAITRILEMARAHGLIES